MRSYKSKSEFFNKMKKKPEQQKVLDNLHEYSEEDIDNLSGSNFPKWIKQVLKEKVKDIEMYKQRGNRTAEEEAQRIATIMMQKNNGDQNAI